MYYEYNVEGIPFIMKNRSKGIGKKIQSEECIIVQKGTAKIYVGDESFILNDGDTITFSSKIPHGWKNIGEDMLELLWIITPPSF